MKVKRKAAAQTDINSIPAKKQFIEALFVQTFLKKKDLVQKLDYLLSIFICFAIIMLISLFCNVHLAVVVLRSTSLTSYCKDTNI